MNCACRPGIDALHAKGPAPVDAGPFEKPGEGASAQSSRKTRSLRSWRSCASSESVAIGRASRRLRDRLAGLLAIAVGAVVDAGDGGVDLGDQLALPVAGAQFDGAIGFGGGPVGDVRVILALLLQGDQGLLASRRISSFQARSLPRKYSR